MSEQLALLVGQREEGREREGRRGGRGKKEGGRRYREGAGGGDANGHEVSLVTAATEKARAQPLTTVSNGYQENPILMRELNIAL